jgi:hypothetical protein
MNLFLIKSDFKMWRERYGEDAIVREETRAAILKNRDFAEKPIGPTLALTVSSRSKTRRRKL